MIPIGKNYIKEVADGLHSVHGLLSRYVEKDMLSLEEKGTICNFYWEYQDTNILVDFVETQVMLNMEQLNADLNVLLKETSSFLQFYKSSKSDLSSFNTKKEYEENIRPYDEAWKIEADKANKIGHELSESRNRLESFFFGCGMDSSDPEYAMLEQKCDNLSEEYRKISNTKDNLYKTYREEVRKTAFLSFFEIEYLYALADRLYVLANNLISIVSDFKKGGLS